MTSLLSNLISDSDIDVPVYASPNKSADGSSISSTPPVIAEHPSTPLPIVRKRGRPKSNFLSIKKINPRAKRGYLSDSLALTSGSSRHLNFLTQDVDSDIRPVSEGIDSPPKAPPTVVRRRRRRKPIANTFSKLDSGTDIRLNVPGVRSDADMVSFCKNVGETSADSTINSEKLNCGDNSALSNQSISTYDTHMQSLCQHTSSLSNAGMNMKQSGCCFPHSVSFPTNDYFGKNGHIPSMHQRTSSNTNNSRVSSNMDDSPSHSQCGSFSFEENLIRRLLPQTEAAISAGRAAGLSGPHTWTTEMVAAFIATLPGCSHLAEAFSENEIDGPALLCMDQFDLLSSLRLKLGPTVKVLGAIRTFRRTMMSIPPADLAEDHAAAFTSMSSYFTLASDAINGASERWKNSSKGFQPSNGNLDHSGSTYDSNLSVIQTRVESGFPLVNGV